MSFLSLHHRLSFGIILLTLFACFGIVEQSAAQMDSRCFSKSECEYTRRELGIPENQVPNGHYREPDAIGICGDSVLTPTGDREEMGFCLPADYAKTQISFGGRTEFLHLGDFFQYIQRYGFIVGSILAVLVTILSGVQWMMSSDSSGVQAAKKRIAGAILGLAFLAFSYTLLNTINPQLVNLRLPQIWLINEQRIGSTYCDGLQSDQNLGVLSPFERKDMALDPRKTNNIIQDKNRVFATKPAQASCEEQYVIDNPGGPTCYGTACSVQGEVCTRANSIKAKCLPTLLTGWITARESLFCDDLNSRSISDGLHLMAVCQNGTIDKITREINPQFDKEMNQQFFRISRPSYENDLANACGNSSVVGYFLAMEINDASGLYCNAGSDDWFAVGKTPMSIHSDQTNRCEINLGPLAQRIIGKPQRCTSDTDNINCTCAGVVNALKDNPKLLLVNDDFKRFLFTPDDLAEGRICDVHITRKEFPDIDVGTNSGSCS